ncbi:MAG: hypothetical protein H0U80_06610, partial [Solirubrobacterales bacterium]|nr:hypothetical protein [Solirubrobacterales bacterium]
MAEAGLHERAGEPREERVMELGKVETREGQSEATVERDRFKLLVESVKDYAILMLDPHGRIV